LDDGAKIYAWSRCDGCGSLFLNPYSDARDNYRRSTYHAGKFTDGRPTYEGGFIGRWAHMQKFMPESPVGLLDAACGAGQYLSMAADSGLFSGPILGMEISEMSVAAINMNAKAGAGFVKAEAWDLDAAPIVGRVFDFIIFSEAFEHVQEPRAVIKSLAGALSPRGRIYFTAQSPHGGLPIRPGEPIYTTENGLRELLDHLSLRVVHFELSSGRWTVVAERA